MKLFLKWMLLVCLSAVVGFVIAALDNQKAPHIFGMLLGIFTFVLIYFFIDMRLKKNGKFEFRKSLLLSIYIKMGLQFVPFLEVFAGMISGLILEAVKYNTSLDIGNSLLESYILTVLVALQLSLVVSVLFLIISFLKNKKTKTK